MKAAIWLGAGVGGVVGGWLPSLWGADFFSPWSVILSAIGGIAGILIVYRLYQAS